MKRESSNLLSLIISTCLVVIVAWYDITYVGWRVGAALLLFLAIYILRSSSQIKEDCEINVNVSGRKWRRKMLSSFVSFIAIGYLCILGYSTFYTTDDTYLDNVQTAIESDSEDDLKILYTNEFRETVAIVDVVNDTLAQLESKLTDDTYEFVYYPTAEETEFLRLNYVCGKANEMFEQIDDDTVLTISYTYEDLTFLTEAFVSDYDAHISTAILYLIALICLNIECGYFVGIILSHKKITNVQGNTDTEEVSNSEVCSAIIDKFEDLLDEKDITVPCASEMDEINRKDNDSSARLYGAEYWGLVGSVEGILEKNLMHK